MAVIYLFDAAKQLRRLVREGVQEIIHSEGEYNAVTQILAKDAPEHGDYFGFKCMDGRFRLFWITNMEINDEAGTCMLTGTDAAVAELEGRVVTELPLQNTTAAKAVTAALQGTGWSIGTQTGNGQVNTESAYFATLWATIKKIAAAGGVRAVPYYEFSGNRITAKKIDLLDKTPVFSGLIYTRKRGAENIHISYEGTPYGRVFPVGKIIGDGEPPEQVTIADAVWSRANGDPADKPAGQKYIDLPGAISNAEYVYEDKKETDPAKLMQKAFAALEATQKPIASGTANLNDMEYMPGYEHMQAQMWMLAVVRAETGQMVETTIINIERYYVHRELTKITVGDEDANEDMLENMIASMRAELLDTARVAGGGSAGAGKAKEMVLEAEERIQLNSKQIQANADQITLRAFSADVVKLADETEVNFREVYVDIDLNRAEISATNQFVDNLNNEVSGINATLTVQAGQIAAKASQYDLDALGNRVATAESELIVQAGQISTKVSENGVISSINQTAEEIKIQAKKINLSGYVTATAFEAEMAIIDNVFAGYSEISALGISGNLYAANARFTDNLSIFNRVCTWRDVTMGEVASSTLLGAGLGGALDLQHSHAVTVDASSGLVTLGEVSATGGNFNIADTTFYKNGVSASYNKGKTDWSPVKIERTDYSIANKSVTVRALNAAGVPLIALEEIDASEIYAAGAAEGGYDEGYTAGYQAAVDAITIGYSSFTITNTAANTFFASARIWAKVDGETVQSSTITKTQTINVGQ